MKKILLIISILLTQNLFINSVNFAQSYSSMYISSSSPQNGISGWTTVTGFSEGEKSSDWSLSSDELTKSSGSSTALYFVSFSLSFSGSVTGNWGVGVSVNGTNPNSISATRYLANQDVGNVSASGYLTLNPSDIVSFMVNPPSSANLNVSFASVSLVRIEDVSAYNSYSEMGFYNNTSTISIGTSFTDLSNAGYTSSNFQNWSHGSGVLTAGSGSTGTYFVSASFSFSGSANNEFTLGVSKNNSDPVRIVGRRKISNGNDIGNIMIWGILSITEGVDNIRFKVKANGNNKDLTVQFCHISVIKISGGTRDVDPFPYASMNISTSSPTPISLTASTDNQVIDYSNDITDNSYWSFSNSQFSPIGISSGYYRVNYFISYSTSSAADLTFKVFNNGTEITQLTNRRKTSNTDRGAVGGNGIILIENAADQLSLVANPSSGVDLSVYQSRLSLSRLEKTSDISFPVELTSFSVIIINGNIKLNWRTETELNNYGFDILRRSAEGGQDEEWVTIGFVDGHGNSNSPKEYSFIDDNILSGKYAYKLKQIDNDGTFEYSKVIEVDMDTPVEYELSQNYPNPFNPETTIKFNITKAGIVKLSLYNVLGERKGIILSEFKEAGIHTVNFNASELNSGIYVYKLEVEDFIQMRKMILIK